MKIFSICFEDAFLITAKKCKMSFGIILHDQNPYDRTKYSRPFFRHSATKKSSYNKENESPTLFYEQRNFVSHFGHLK